VSAGSGLTANVCSSVCPRRPRQMEQLRPIAECSSQQNCSGDRRASLQRRAGEKDRTTASATFHLADTTWNDNARFWSSASARLLVNAIHALLKISDINDFWNVSIFGDRDDKVRRRAAA